MSPLYCSYTRVPQSVSSSDTHPPPERPGLLSCGRCRKKKKSFVFFVSFYTYTFCLYLVLFPSEIPEVFGLAFICCVLSSSLLVLLSWFVTSPPVDHHAIVHQGQLNQTRLDGCVRSPWHADAGLLSCAAPLNRGCSFWLAGLVLS